MAHAAHLPRIRYLIFDAFGVGGTVRTVVNIANYLSRCGYDVEIASIMRWRETPFFPIDPSVRVKVLNDWKSWTTRKWVDWRVLAGAAARVTTHSRLIHPDDEAYRLFSRMTDWSLARYLSSLRSGILITTRSSLNLAAVEQTHGELIRIGQEHESYTAHPAALNAAISQKYGRLDALVTLTETAAAYYRTALGNSGPSILTIPNAALSCGLAAPLQEKVVIAFGRLVPVKGYDLLVEAFGKVAALRPAWTLKIFGGGPDRKVLETLIRQKGLSARIFLMGPSSSIDAELRRASICAVSSRSEGFPMSIVEAMTAGVPVVSFDCPTGPSEIIRDGQDGFLVPPEDTAALAARLIRLIDDEGLRKRFGARARENVAQYRLDVIGDRWNSLFRSLAAGRAHATEDYYATRT
jgi:glycosyltransferase involved in cell wall biosynthesis